MTFNIIIPVEVDAEDGDTPEALAQYIEDIALDVIHEALQRGDLQYRVEREAR